MEPKKQTSFKLAPEVWPSTSCLMRCISSCAAPSDGAEQGPGAAVAADAQAVPAALRRDLIILPATGAAWWVWKWQDLQPVETKPEMTGHHLGDFSIAHKPGKAGTCHGSRHPSASSLSSCY